MRVIVGCESSGTVREAFRSRGHDAWSCDLLPADDGSPHHYQEDIFALLHRLGRRHFDLAILHPECTHLAVSGSRHFAAKQESGVQEDALDFVFCLMAENLERWCIENPVSIISSRITKPDQIVHPYQFGHDASKKTCLWLHRLPLLKPPPAEQWVPPRMVDGKPRWANQTDSGQNKLGPSEDRWKKRSVTYSGIAKAMAEQWGDL